MLASQLTCRGCQHTFVAVAADSTGQAMYPSCGMLIALPPTAGEAKWYAAEGVEGLFPSVTGAGAAAWAATGSPWAKGERTAPGTPTGPLHELLAVAAAPFTLAARLLRHAGGAALVAVPSRVLPTGTGAGPYVPA
jgi:hypothetical protein